MASGYLSQSEYDSQSERLKGTQRFLKIKQQEEKVKQDSYKLQAEQLNTQAASELPKQSKNNLLIAQAKTQVSGSKVQIAQIDAQTASSEVGLRKDLASFYLQGLRAQVDSVKLGLQGKNDDVLEAEVEG